MSFRRYPVLIALLIPLWFGCDGMMPTPQGDAGPSDPTIIDTSGSDDDGSADVDDAPDTQGADDDNAGAGDDADADGGDVIGDGDDAGDDGADDGADDSADGGDETGDQDALPGDDEPTASLTDDEKAAADEAVQAVERLAGVFVASLSALDAGSILRGLLGAPNCPIVSGVSDANLVVATLDYQNGCQPSLYPDVTVRGVATATVFPLALTFDSLAVDGRSLDGGLTASFFRSGGAATLISVVDLIFSGSDLRGDVSVVVVESTGGMTISDATISITPASAGVGEMILDEVEIDPAGNGNFLPQAGMASWEIDSNGDGSAGVPILIVFSAQTPVDGTVLVSIAGADPIAYTPGG